MTARNVPLGLVLRLRNEIVHPRDLPSGDSIFVGLEHVESGTGRRIGQLQIRLQDLTGRKSRFYPGDIVYGYLRPYLSKVWLADIDGFCSVDQYVFRVDRAAAHPAYVAHFMRSRAYLTAAPIDVTPGQLPRIRTEEVLSVKLPLPPVDRQIEIAEKLDAQLLAAARAKSAAVQSVAAAEALRGALLTRAFERERERSSPPKPRQDD
jgi:type I restriction enzyme S subunit